MPGPSSCLIHWTFRAERQLEQALIRSNVLTGSSLATALKMNDLNKILRAAFPGASEVLVLDQYMGFRFREGEYTLLVEVRDPSRGGNYVVKIKKAKALQKEWNAWRSCRPSGMRSDLVFMVVEPLRITNQLAALVYQDAQQFIGMERTVSLEEAVLGAVRGGDPSPETVASVLTDLFARLGHVLYRAAAPVPAVGPVIRLNGRRALNQSKRRGEPSILERWSLAEAREARQVGDNVVPVNTPGFSDPVDYFLYAAGKMKGGAAASKFIPEMLRGKAHGDLHGRNVLVGLFRGRAHWPALYDYEHMAADNLVGWDFVKLETELKIRAYLELFGNQQPLDFAASLMDFETKLAERTEAYRRSGGWPATAGNDRGERLAMLLLTIRRLAGVHLGEEHNRWGRWLEEYYFLLACYGLSTVNFDNLKFLERLGTFMSAGVAVARFLYSRDKRLGSGPGGVNR